MKKIVSLLFIICSYLSNGQEFAIVKYSGGGDWYANPTSIPNLIDFCNKNINTKISTTVKTVEPNSVDIFQYPYVYLTGHGNVEFTDDDIINLRNYLNSGGFLHIDDNYGLDEFIRKELKKLYPDQELKELALNHQIFSNVYKFKEGLPKIHEHDGKRPQALGLFYKERLVCLYTFESDLGDGWEDKEVHGNPEEIRQIALKFGANIIQYVFTN